MKALETPYYQFINNPYECALNSSINNRVTFDIMDKDLSRHDMIEQFEYFLKACGFHFAPGESIDIVTQED